MKLKFDELAEKLNEQYNNEKIVIGLDSEDLYEFGLETSHSNNRTKFIKVNDLFDYYNPIHIGDNDSGDKQLYEINSNKAKDFLSDLKRYDIYGEIIY